MNVTVDHDGVTWTRSRSVGFALGVLVLWSAAVLGLAAVGAWVGAVAAVVGGALVGVGLRRWLGTAEQLRITVRALTVGSLAIRVDDIARASVSRDPRTDRVALLVDTIRGDQHVLAMGAPADQLDWFLERVEDARAVDAGRARAEGREWWFLRHPPREIDRLRGP